MSDKKSSDKESFIHNGHETHLIHPRYTADLSMAFDRINYLQELINSQPSETKTYNELKARQLSLIQEYVKNIKGYDAALFQMNIAYLAKTYNLKISQLEESLGISTGYISRILNENYSKRMSIDMAWQIAQLFNEDLTTMLTVNMQNMRGNTALALRFLDKLTKMTYAAEVEWHNHLGGARAPYEDCDLCQAEIIKVTKDEETIYLIDAGYGDEGNPVTGDIMSLPKFINGEEDLFIIPETLPWEGDRTHYDFLAIKYENDKIISWRKFIDIIEALDDTLENAAAKLYKAIGEQYFDVKFYDDHKNFISNFLKN